jgi:A/G-specific adenine glycosylase
VLKSKCKAYYDKLVDRLPVKEKKITKKTRWFYYLVIEHNGKQYVRKRGAKDIWENLYEFVLLENDAALPLEKFKKLPQVKTLFGKNTFEIIHISPIYKQLLTHQTIQGQFVSIKTGKPLTGKDYEAIEPAEIDKLPFPKFIAAYLKDKNVSLNLF